MSGFGGARESFKLVKQINLEQLNILLAGQPGVVLAFALCAELCRFAPLAPLSFLVSRSLSPKMNILPKGKYFYFLNFHNSSFGVWKKVTWVKS